MTYPRISLRFIRGFLFQRDQPPQNKFCFGLTFPPQVLLTKVVLTVVQFSLYRGRLPCVPRSINCSSTNHCLDLRYCCRLFDSSVISFPDLTMFLRRKYCYFALMLGCLSIQSSGVSQPMGTISQKCWLGYHPSIFVPQARPALAEETSASFLGEIGDFSPRIC